MTASSMEKPLSDERQYRHFVLGDEMDVLLISDPETDKASGACDVYCGQLCDTLPGIAHFCEHMLFIGTKKYPTENAYDSYLSTHGGSSNAFTDLEHTCYYFDVQAESLEGSLDRFAQCFIGPLFTQSAIEREVQAVDSEHAKNNQQDPWRMYQLSKSQIGSKDHMFASFGSGNQASLPTEGIREKLLDFYQKNYRRSLGLYKLVVLGKESLDDLEIMVHRYFDDLAKTFQDEQGDKKGTEKRADILKDIYPPMPSWQVPKRLHVMPVSQVHAVELQFPLPPTLAFYKQKPTRYLSHLIGHEGKGSLLSCLKAKHYAQELYADAGSASCNPFSIFTIRLELTELGLGNIDDIMDIVFAYIDLLKQEGPQKWVQDELKTVGDLQFKFLSKRNPMDYACSLAGWMQHYPPEHYLSGAYKLYGWEAESVNACLEGLNPDNMLMMLSSPTMEGTTSSTCPWFGTQYDSIPVDETLWTRWRTMKHSDYPELALPEVNDMIATDFDLLKSSELPKDMPICISKTKTLRLWFKPDNVFNMPKVNALFQFSSKDSLSTPESSIGINLFSMVVQELCNEFTYLASMAGLHSDISFSSAGLELQVSGYNHKAHILVQRVIDTLTGLESIEPEMFSRMVAKLEQQYESFLVSQPYQHAIHGGDLCLDHGIFTVFEKLNALKHISAEEVIHFSKRFFKHCQVEALVHGNVTAEHTKEMAETVLKRIKGDFDESTTHSSIERRVVELPEKTSCLYRFAEYNDANTNSCLQIVLQMGQLELYDNSTLAFLHHLIREPAFNQLRTEEQLGYIVHTSVKTSGDNVKGLLFLIQSDSFDPIHVEARVEEFLARFRERIISMSSEDFQKNVDAVVTSFLEKNKNLGEESSRYWHLIQNQTYHFARLQEIAEHVKAITKDRVLMFFDKYVAALAPCRRKLCVQVFAKQHQEQMNAEFSDDIILIENPEDFRREMPLYPLPKKVEVKVHESVEKATNS